VARETTGAPSGELQGKRRDIVKFAWNIRPRVHNAREKCYRCRGTQASKSDSVNLVQTGKKGINCGWVKVKRSVESEHS